MYRIAKTNEPLVKCGVCWERASVRAVLANASFDEKGNFRHVLTCDKICWHQEEIDEAIKNGIIVETDDSLD